MKDHPFYIQPAPTSPSAIPIKGAALESWATEAAALPASTKAWVNAQGFKGAPRTLCLIPHTTGELAQVFYGKSTSPHDAFWDAAWLAATLPVHQSYYLDDPGIKPEDLQNFGLAWQLATYVFRAYKNDDRSFPTLYLKDEPIVENIEVLTQAIFTIRDLINMPADQMTPGALAAIAEQMAHRHGATFELTQGPALEKEYPLVYGVGKGAATPPCFVEIQWGNRSHPTLTLIGKGVTFDTGGLDIKTSGNMLLMKKDMGGAAHALALGSLIMTHNLPVCLHILLPLAENAVGSRATKPGDVLHSRKGLTVEIKNTDAEGRLLLADALTRASELGSKHIIDFATLTGAARVALGTEVPALFSNQPEKAQALVQLAGSMEDPLWQLPLWQPYAKTLSSTIAHLTNLGAGPYGGAITAALFLEKFVDPSAYWIHIDMMAWNLQGSPGRPEGGEAMGIRAVFEHIRQLYSPHKN